MAAANGKKGYTIRFELSLAGLLGVGVVLFCIFLWMFLLGLWAGQAGLISGLASTSQPAVPAATKLAGQNKKVREAPLVVPEPEPESRPAEEDATSGSPSQSPAGAVQAETLAATDDTDGKTEEPAFYAIQVGAFRDDRNVEEALQEWRAKGYEAFARPPEGNEHLTKVYLGHFPVAAAARKEAETLAKKEGLAPVVARIPAAPAKRP